MTAKPAGFWIRSAAALVDTAILLVACLPIELVIYRIGLSRLSTADLWDDMFTFYLIASGFYHVLWIWKRGATPGKAVFRLKVIPMGENGERLRFWRSFSRWLGYLASFSIFFAGFLMAAFHPKKRTIHDLLAGSRVIRSG